MKQSFSHTCCYIDPLLNLDLGQQEAAFAGASCQVYLLKLRLICRSLFSKQDSLTYYTPETDSNHQDVIVCKNQRPKYGPRLPQQGPLIYGNSNVAAIAYELQSF